MDRAESFIVEVFSRVDAHRRVAALIKQHSTNLGDIRAIALDQLDLSHAQTVLELGCGFGSFVEALKGRLPPDAVLTGLDIIPAYREHFLDACRKAGIRGRFSASGVSQMETYASGACDLVLCSFALYFFPQIIPHVARILTPRGAFITITHDRYNMWELIELIKGFMRMNGLLKEELLPIEQIISRFCAENGKALLDPWFEQIKSIDYVNRLIFLPEEIRHLAEYFRFKSSFFLAGTDNETEDVIRCMSGELEQSSLSREGLLISKNDRIFICSGPHSDRRHTG